MDGQRMSLSFLEELAQARPDPGGGAAAAFGATLGLALVEKVVRLEANRCQEEKLRGRWEEMLQLLQEMADTLVRLREEDVRVYSNLARARAESDAAGLPEALQEAVRCPVRIIQGAREGLTLIAKVGEHCRRHLVADLLVAAEFLNAALLGAYHIACANLSLVSEPQEREFLARELVRACQPACELFYQVKVELVSREHDLDHRS